MLICAFRRYFTWNKTLTLISYIETDVSLSICTNIYIFITFRTHADASNTCMYNIRRSIWSSPKLLNIIFVRNAYYYVRILLLMYCIFFFFTHTFQSRRKTIVFFFLVAYFKITSFLLIQYISVGNQSIIKNIILNYIERINVI